MAIESLFSGVGERRMADVVHQRERFGQVFIQPEHTGHGAGDLRDLDRVGQAVAEMIGETRARRPASYVPGGERLANEQCGRDRAGRRCGTGVRVGISAAARRLHRKPQMRIEQLFGGQFVQSPSRDLADVGL